MRVLLATDRPSLGAALALYLGEHHVDVVGVVAHAPDILGAVAATDAQVVVVDRHLGPCVVDAVAEMKRSPRRTPIVVLRTSAQASDDDLPDVDAHVALGEPPEALLAVLESVGAGVADSRSTDAERRTSAHGTAPPA
jgi:DNA-binding NarL/FixJ family response regulator